MATRRSAAARRVFALSNHLGTCSASSSTLDTSHSIATQPTCANHSQSFCPSVIRIHPEVAQALSEGKPVVALESTIISHGMPYPQNLSTAKEVEQVVRNNGAVPATIAILDGVVHVGLDEQALEKLAKLGQKVHKTSRRDFAAVLAKGANGATTVSGTSYIASLVGISVFATGGIGGVHRGGEVTMDVSADLTELGRTPIAVVCAGAKSLLDIGRTLEYLETQGVAVVGYGTDEFPAFFTPTSGFKASCRMDTPEECAKMIVSSRKLGLGSGMVIAVPIPPHHAAEATRVENAIQQAIKESQLRGISGNEVTPFLLARVNELTGGESLKSNICLIKNNAAVAAQIATKLSEILGKGKNCTTTTTSTMTSCCCSQSNVCTQQIGFPGKICEKNGVGVCSKCPGPQAGSMVRK
jgi:pseudouridine-5'-phosphate glycosidase